MTIIDFGVGERMRVCREQLSNVQAEIKLLLLPIPTTRDKEYITGTDIRLDELRDIARSCDAVAGYAIPKDLGLNGDIYDASLDEDFLLANAVLTAKGTLGYLLSKLGCDPCEKRIGIVGYGRIGRELLRLLLLIGADATVLTTRHSVIMELGELGIRSELVGQSNCISEFDILINTAPARQIKLAQLKNDCIIIDLASGICFDSDERLIKLPSLPEQMYPVTAGKLYAKYILKALFGEGHR